MKRMQVLSIVTIALAVCGHPGTANDSTGPKAPNLLVDVSGSVINGIVQRTIDRHDPVEETILDTPVEGKSRTIALVRAELIPSPSFAAVDVVFNGKIYSRTTSIRPFVLIHTIGTTSVDVRRRVLIDARGIRNVAGPSCADSTSALLDVTCRKEYDALAIRFGRQLFEQNVVEGDIESAHKAANRISRELALELASPLASASKSIAAGVQEFTRAGLKLEAMHYQTTPTYVQGRLRFAGPAISHAPPLLATTVDLGVRVHQSLVTDVARSALAGKTFSLDKIDNLYDDVTRGFLLDGRKGSEQQDGLKKLAALLGTLGAKATTITLAKDDPVTAAFADGGFAVDIHISTIQDEKVDYEGMRVKAAYQFENTPRGIFAVRKGPIQYGPAVPLPGKKLEPQTETLRLLREVLFAEVVKERFIVNIPTPDALGNTRFQPPGADARNGWLALGWKLASRKD